MSYKNIFLYHLDYELQRLFGIERQYSKSLIINSFTMATKIALLLCEDSIIIPTSNYLESDIAFEILNKFIDGSGINTEIIKLVSSSYNIEEFLAKKKVEHGEDITRKGYHYSDFMEPNSKIYLPGSMLKRKRSASEDIRRSLLNEHGLLEISSLLQKHDYNGNAANKTIDIFDILGRRAIIASNIMPSLGEKYEKNCTLENEMNMIITREYLRSYMEEFNAYCIKNIPLMTTDMILPEECEDRYIDYNHYANVLKTMCFKSQNAYYYIKNASLKELLEFKYSKQWQRLVNPTPHMGVIKEEKGEDMAKKNSREKVTIGIIAALPNEYAAVKTVMGTVEYLIDDNVDNGLVYEVGLVNTIFGSEHTVAIVQCSEGNNKAAISATEMIRFFPNLKVIVFSGIAAGIPTDVLDIRLGDIVVGKEIIQYDYVKIKDGSKNQKAIPVGMGPIAQRTVNRFEVESKTKSCKWNELLLDFAINDFKRPEDDTDVLYDSEDNVVTRNRRENENPVVFSGVIASGNAVIKSAKYREEIYEATNAIAIEMEGAGIEDACNNGKIDTIVVRGICDYADNHKNDVWHDYAAMVAAVFSINLIKFIPPFK